MYFAYDFKCLDCNHNFSDLTEKDEKKPNAQCPRCECYNTERSLFNNTTVKSSDEYKKIYNHFNGKAMADKIARETKIPTRRIGK